MLGIAVASRKNELAQDWGGHDQYEGLQMIRSDCGQVWANGPQAEKLGSIGKIVGHEVLAELELQADGSATLTLSCPSLERGPVTTRFAWVGPHVRNGGIHWAMLTYRTESRFVITQREDSLASSASPRSISASRRWPK